MGIFEMKNRFMPPKTAFQIVLIYILIYAFLNSGCNPNYSRSLGVATKEPSQEVVQSTLPFMETRIPTPITLVATVNLPTFSLTSTQDLTLPPRQTQEFTKTSTNYSVLAGMISISENSSQSGNNYVLDENGNITWTVPYFEADLQVPGQPCFFYGATENYRDRIQIKKYSLQGEIVQEKDIKILPEIRDKRDIHNLSFSPNAEWITYVWPSGLDAKDLMDPMDSMNLELDLINVNQINGIPITITNSGGSTRLGGTWSPDSRHLAYSDRDSFGIDQIYILDLASNQKVKISSFGSARPFKLKELKFSPDGSTIAFYGAILHEIAAPNQSTSLFWNEGIVGTISLQNKKTQFYALPKDFFNPIGSIWWNQKSDQFLILLEGYGPEQNFYSGDLTAWFGVQADKIIHTFPEKVTEDVSIRYIFPIKDIERVVIYGDTTLVYDKTINSTLERKFPDKKSIFLNYLYLNGTVNLSSCGYHP
jgi:hypothetical protein